MAKDEELILFVGNYSYSLDGKDRINIPSKFRRILPKEANDSFIITKGAEYCLHLYPSNYWHQFVQRYWDVFYSNQIEYRRFAIWVYRDTYEVQFDKQGRIQLPRVLLDYANLKKEVRIIGYNTRIELWNPEYCDEFVGAENEKYMKMAADFTSVPPFSNVHPSPTPSNPNQPPASQPVPPPNPMWGYPHGPGFNPYYPQYPPL